MSSQEVSNKLSAETVIGVYAVGFSLLGVMGVLHAISHTGLSSLIGWVGFVASNFVVYKTGRFSRSRDKWRFSNTTFIILLIVWISSMTAILTSMAGLWDAR